MNAPTASALPAVSASLFSKILEWMLMPLLIIWPTCMGITYLVAISLANQVSDRALASDARALSEQLIWQPDRKTFALLVDLRTILSDEEVANVTFRVDDENGRYHLGELNLPPARPEPNSANAAATFYNGKLRNVAVRVAQVPRTVEGAPTRAVLMMAETLDKRENIAREIVKGVILPQLLVIPLSVVLVWLGLKSGMSPLERIRQQVVSRNAQDLRPLEAQDAPAEVAPLVVAFNDLLMRIERSNVAQKRFIANAAHQLRTPLAGIRMQSELALRDSAPGEVRQALERIAYGSSQSSHLIAQLLALARAEAGTGETLPFQILDLNGVAGEVVRETYSLAAAKNIDLGLEAPETPVEIDGHPPLLREMLVNLVDNAIRYTPAGGRITVRVKAGETPGLEIEDNGIGIPESERELVFERFYRVENHAEPGSGIGLAIVKEIVSRHRAAIEALVPAGGTGTLMRVTFPPLPGSAST
jgi:two-component system sensor histidine kinase TctE